MTPRFAFAAGAVVIVLTSVLLRTVWLQSDPPSHPSIGIVWHDEGAWVHNARNRALWGVWRTDAWNPVFVTPVFTGLEYGAFRLLGVGTWQARIVPAVSGVVAVVALMAGLAALAGLRAALAGGALLATNFVFVMWNRAALIESTMIAAIVVSWGAYARAARRPSWGVVAGAAAAIAWFTKAAAAFFVAALVLESLWSWATARHSDDPRGTRLRAVLTIAGLAGVAACVVAVFVWPHWSEYAFYNWQMSVTRKPDYGVRAIADRITWLPLVQGSFAGMWPVLAAASVGLVATAASWPHRAPADRLLLLWFVIGLIELVVHDAGNERRYVMFVPAIIALAVRWIADDSSPVDAARAKLVAPLVALAAYLVAGSALRIVLADDVTAGRLSLSVRIAAIAAAAAAIVFVLRTVQAVRWLRSVRGARGLLPGLVVLGLAWNVGDYARWLRHRAAVNVEASRQVGALLPAGTPVQGKLAAGLALENRIRPLFIGNGFGNYADRFARDDVRYILTYDLPRVGYESSDGSNLLRDLLEHYPAHRIIASFEVDESPERDRAILIDKRPSFPHPDARD
jgi:4-amino-4-deoxy-L-arabinose transferase-like glycosyltransferase